MKTLDRFALACLSSALVIAPGTAFAQDATPAAPPVVTPAPAPAPSAAPAGEPEPGVRFRWGITPMGGAMFGGVSGGAGGLDARFGAQISNMLGVYAQPSLIIGVGTASNDNGAGGSVLALYGVGALADFTFGDTFYVAAGPELLSGGLASTSTTANGVTTSSQAVSGTFFSIPIRAGVVLGSKKPDRRKGFTIGLDMRTIFTPGSATVIPMLALGYESF